MAGMNDGNKTPKLSSFLCPLTRAKTYWAHTAYAWSIAFCWPGVGSSRING